jgi:iron complex outermembrane recepter protein
MPDFTRTAVSMVMTAPVSQRHVRRYAFVFIWSLLLAVRLPAGEPVKFQFNLPSDAAEKSVKRLAEQSGVDVLLSTNVARDVRTNVVKGEFTAREALERMLAGTGLVAVQDAQTGALTIRREGSDPNGERAPVGNAPTGSPITMEKFEVSGTKDTGIVNQGVIPREEKGAIRYQLIDRATIEHSGATSVSELFYRQVPAATSPGTGTQRTFAFASTFSNGFGTTTDALNLRGFGTIATVTLVNGRRLYASEQAGADVSRFPIVAIDRIEIMPVSASAIYGGNAIGGVVNVILRKGFQGAELTTYFGTSTQGGAAESHASYYHGFVRGKTNVSLSLDFVHKEPLGASQRSYYHGALSAVPPGSTAYVSQVAQIFVGPTATLVSATGAGLGVPGTTAATFAGVPTGSSGTGLTPADFNASAGKGNISESRLQRAVLLPRSDTESGFLLIEHAIHGENLGAYAELGFRYSNYAAAYPGFTPALALASSNSINPFHSGVTPGFVGQAVNVFVDPIDLPDARTQSLQRALRLVGGFKGRFAQERWRWSTDFSWDRTDSHSGTTDYLRFLRAAVTAGIYNPLRDLSRVQPQTVAELQKYFSHRESLSHPETTAANARLNGSVWTAPGGDAQLSVGSELRFENNYAADRYTAGAYATLAGASLPASTKTQTSRRTLAEYAEALIPVVGAPNRKSWAYALEISAAARHEAYDDFGSVTSPMVGVKYAPARDLAFRGSYGEGFLPPTQANLFTATVTTGPSAAAYVDPRRPGVAISPITQTTGGNPALRAQTSKTLDWGVVLEPRWLPNLTLSASYYRYDMRDRIVTPAIQDVINWEAFFPERVQRAAASPADQAANRPGQITGLNTTPINVARLVTTGIDFKFDYQIPTQSYGRFAVSADGTMGRSFRNLTVAGANWVETVGDIGNGMSVYPPLHLRGKLGLHWEQEHYSVTWAGRYTDRYITNTTVASAAFPTKTGYDGGSINASFTMDLQFTYAVPYRMNARQRGLAAWLGGTRWTLGCLNILDQRPPYLTNGLGWYSLFEDPRQRFAYVEIRKSL